MMKKLVTERHSEGKPGCEAAGANGVVGSPTEDWHTVR